MSQLCDGCLVALTSDQRYHLCRVRLTVAALLLAVQPAGKSCPSRMALLFYIFSTQFDWDAFEMPLSCVLEERVRRSISEYWSSAASPLLSTSLTLKPRRCSFQYYWRQPVILSQRVHTWQTSRTNASLLSPLDRCFTLQLVDPGQGHTKSRASLKLCLYWGMADTIIEQQNRSLGCTDMQDPALHSVSLGIKPEISWASTPGMRLDLSRTTLHFHSDARTHNAWKPWVGTEVVGTF